MLTDYVIMPGADYQDACDAIREKTGKTDVIVSGDMGEEIRGISGGEDLLAARLTNTLKEYSNESIETINNYAFFMCNQLERAYLPNVYLCGSNCFDTCNKLTEVVMPKLQSIGNYMFQSCSMLSELNFPVAQKIGLYGFSYCICEKIDLPCVTEISGYAFSRCSNIKDIVLRYVDGVCKLSNVNAFNDTPFNSAQTCGNCFVPRDLVSQYQDATNWSTLRAAGSCVFYPLEDYTVDGTTTGEMDWDKVNALPHENDSSSVSPV